MSNKKLVIYALAIFIVSVVAVFVFSELKPLWIEILTLNVFFFVATLLVDKKITHTIQNKKPAAFSSIYLGITTGKLFFYIIILAVYGFLFRENAKIFIGSFFILYVLYSVFEVVHLLAVQKKNAQHKKNE